MEESIKIDEKQHAWAVLQNFNSMKSQNEDCDFTIKVGSDEIRVHKNVLKAGSDYFKAMLSHDNLETRSGMVEIKEADKDCVKKCIDFIYTGKISSSAAKRGELMGVAHMMQLQEICDGLAVSLESSLDAKSFCQTKNLANTYNLQELEKKCDQFALQNFRAIASMEEFKHLEKKYVLFLMKSKDIKASEIFKLEALIEWIKHDAGRKRFFTEIFKKLDLSQIPLEHRRHLTENEPLIKESAECMGIITASIFSSINVEAKEVKGASSEPRCLGSNHPIIDGGNNAIVVFDRTSRHLKRYDPLSRTWAQMQAINQDMMSQQLYCSVVLGPHLYVTMQNNKAVYRLDYSELNASWEKIANYTLSLAGSPTVLNDCIYIVDWGYFTKTVESYNPVENKWSLIPNKRIQCLGASLASAKGFLFCIGGRSISSSSYATLRDVEMFNPISSSWSNVQSMNAARYYATAVEVNDNIYCIGGYDGSKAIDTVECYQNDSWTIIAKLNVPRYSLSSSVIGGKLFAIGGDGSSPQTIESLDLEKNRWEMVETLTGKNVEGRASVAVKI